jgi:hypothetical protein
MGQTIKVFNMGVPHYAFRDAKAGDEFILHVHGLDFSKELRANPPRVRLLENSHHGYVECELLTEWPDAPKVWPIRDVYGRLV